MTRLPDLGPRGEGWVVLQFALFGLVALAGLARGEAWAGAAAAVTTIVGLMLVAAGGLLLGAGVLGLGRDLTPMPRPRDGAQLIASGVYASVRHPIYGGVIALAFAWGLLSASPSALLLASLLLGFFELKSRREEAWLAERYDDYPAYMQATRRFFPRLY